MTFVNVKFETVVIFLKYPLKFSSNQCDNLPIALPFPLPLVLEIRKVGGKVGLVARNMLAYQRYGRPPPAGLYARPRPNLGLNMPVLYQKDRPTAALPGAVFCT
jgi:hypothetical protein